MTDAEADCHRIDPSDILLIETDATVWKRNIRRLDRRLAVVVTQFHESSEIRLTVIQVMEGTLLEEPLAFARDRNTKEAALTKIEEEHGK